MQREFMALFASTPEGRGIFGKLFEPDCHAIFSSGKDLMLGLRHLQKTGPPVAQNAAVADAIEAAAPDVVEAAAPAVVVKAAQAPVVGKATAAPDTVEIDKLLELPG